MPEGVRKGPFLALQDEGFPWLKSRKIPFQGENAVYAMSAGLNVDVLAGSFRWCHVDRLQGPCTRGGGWK